MTPLEIQKSIVTAESDINRQLLARDLAACASDFAQLTERTVSVGHMGFSLIRMAAGWMPTAPGDRTPTEPDQSWLQRIIGGAKLTAQLWKLWNSMRSKT